MANRAILTSLHGRELGLAGDRTLIVRAEPDSVGFTPTAGSPGSNTCNVTLQVVTNEGAALAGLFTMIIWLSDAVSGAGLTATTASGTVVAGASGTDLGDLTAKKAKAVQTDLTGKYVLAITDSAKTPFFVAAQVPRRGVAAVSAQLAAANYG
jgi:hypothetical protein